MLHEDFQSTEIPEGEAESGVVADASSPESMGGAVTEEIDFVEFTSALRVRAIGGPCRNPACAGRGCGTGSGQPVDLSLPDLSFLDADVPAAAVVEETPQPEEHAVFGRTASVG